MNLGNSRYFILLLLGIIINLHTLAQVSETSNDDETLEKGIKILKKYFSESNNWHIVQPAIGDDVKGLIHFVEDDPVDSVLSGIDRALEAKHNFVFRLPENVSDSLEIPGYYSAPQLESRLEEIQIYLQKLYQNKEIVIPHELKSNLTERLNLLEEGEGIKLFRDSVYLIPENLKIPEVIPDSMLNSPENFRELQVKDSTLNVYIEEKRIAYNDSVQFRYLDSVATSLRVKQFEAHYKSKKQRMQDSVFANNYQVLKAYNDSVVEAVNDSIYAILATLVEYADYIDTSKVTILNLQGEAGTIRLGNDAERFTRIWLKNEQNDSLSILVKNTDKHSMQMLIDDGVTFTRFKPKETKEFDFKSLEKEISDFNEVGKSYELETPWRIGGDGTIGFTQTYLQNWKKGGQSAISSLIILKGFANYSRADGKIKWENTAELRNGWIRPGGKDSEIQKNDDRFEFTSRYGVSAFKKWYYSAEFNFETQFFKGFVYPTSEKPDPISAFLAPARTFFKVGLEYKPNKDFSLLLSPLTIKNVFVRDTLLVDQTKFGIAKDRKSFWEPGLNADLKLKTQLTEDISFETKYKMFINYQEPFRKFDINWENHLIMRLNEYINMRFMVHFVYDDDVLFPIYNDAGDKIGDEPKLQIKEFLSIGFAYKINKKVMRTNRIR